MPQKIDNPVQFLIPLTFIKAVVLCCYVEGLYFAVIGILYILKINYGILPDIVFLASVLMVVRIMSKDELRRILVWRKIPFAVFAGVLIMYLGFEIIISEFYNLFQTVFPVPYGFFDGWYKPDNIFLLILSNALFPGFTEELFYRGIIARRFFRTYSPRKAILLSSILFGIVHFNPWQAVNAFLGGIFYGWIFWRYKSIWLCMFFHAYYNTLVMLMPLPYAANGAILSHPIWFDILGLLLFGFGLLTVVVLSRKKIRT